MHDVWIRFGKIHGRIIPITMDVFLGKSRSCLFIACFALACVDVQEGARGVSMGVRSGEAAGVPGAGSESARKDDAACTREVFLLPYCTSYTARDGDKAYAYLHMLGYDSVERFQRDQSLSPDGIVGNKTLDAMRRELSRKGLDVEVDMASPDGAPVSVGLSLEDGRVCVSFSNSSEDKPIVIRNRLGKVPVIVGAYSARTADGLCINGGVRTQAALGDGIAVPPSGKVAFKFTPVASDAHGGGSLVRFSCLAVADGRVFPLVSLGLALGGSLEALEPEPRQRRPE